MMNIRNQLRDALAPHLDPLRQRWEQMSRTDRLVWATLGGVSAVVILVFGIWLPSHRASLAAREQYEGNQSLLSYIQANAGHVQGGGAGPGNSGEPILSVVSNSAAANGFTLKRFEPEGERVHIWLDGVPFNKVAAWLDQLSKQGINALNVEVERQQDAGTVSVNVTLSR